MAKPQSAAKKALQKLEDQLQCAICLDPYKDPKLLQCFHVFCKECLERLVVKNQQGQLSAHCPTCRRSTLLLASGVSSLEPAFHINHLFEIQEALKKVKEPQNVQCEKCTKTSRVATSFCCDCGKFICAKCVEMHAEWEEYATHEVLGMDQLERDVMQIVSSKKVVLYCSKHKEKQLELYCETCGEVICFNCTVQLHKGHQYDLIGDMFEKHKSEITASLKPVKTQLGTVNKALQQLDTRHEQITDQRAAIEVEINKTIQCLHQALDARKTELIGQLDHMTQQKLKKLVAQRDDVEMIQTQLNSCLEFVRESLRTGSQAEVMKMKKPVMKQIREMTANFKPDTLEPSEKANMKFVGSRYMVQTCQQFGKVSLQLPSERCYATGKGLESALVEKKATAILHTVNASGKASTIPVESVNCELSSEVNREKTKCVIKQLKGNQHEISYQPTTKGRHQLHIKVEGEHIKGSPFAVMVKLPVQKLGTPIWTIGGLNRPWGVAVNKRGEIIVVENGRECVSIFSQSGERLRSINFGSRGSGAGQLKCPRGVAVDDDDIIVVTDDNDQIMKFTRNGQFITAVRRKGGLSLEFHNPDGIAIHPHSKIVYVADRHYHCIHMLNPDLAFSFGSMGSDNGHFKYPWDVACDNTGNVYVADSGNHCVQVFTAGGQFLRKFGKYGLVDGELNCPSGIAIDSDNVVYVTEWNNHRVSVFTCEGQFLKSFGTKGNGPGQFINPRRITVDKSGVVYVSDGSHVYLF